MNAAPSRGCVSADGVRSSLISSVCSLLLWLTFIRRSRLSRPARVLLGVPHLTHASHSRNTPKHRGVWTRAETSFFVYISTVTTQWAWQSYESIVHYESNSIQYSTQVKKCTLIIQSKCSLCRGMAVLNVIMHIRNPARLKGATRQKGWEPLI